MAKSVERSRASLWDPIAHFVLSAGGARDDELRYAGRGDLEGRRGVLMTSALRMKLNIRAAG